MPGASAYELAIAVNLHPSTLTQALKRLTRKNLILVVEDPRDSRKKIISLTRVGKVALDQSEPEMQALAGNLAKIEKELYLIEDFLASTRAAL